METLELTAEVAATPAPAVCGNCKFFEPHLGFKTKRVHPSKEGRCGWKPNIKWALAYRRNGYGWQEQDPRLNAVGVWKWTDATTCACFTNK